jgi:hypothetical protein
MKAVQELVSYFDRRGKLSKRQIRRILDQGMLAADAPQTMQALGDSLGASFYFRVTGAAEGSLWGTDIYTGDSALGVAAVHAGLVKPGERAVVKVTVVPPLTAYKGSVRNGVVSHDFARYGSAYRLEAV